MASPAADADGPIASINVTPLVDVVLVLLVVLMVTATFLASQSIPVDLPAASTGVAREPVLTVSVGRGGELAADGRAVSDAELRAEVARHSAGGTAPLVVLAADGAVPHRRVVEVVDLLRRERVTELGFAVDPSDLARGRP